MDEQAAVAAALEAWPENGCVFLGASLPVRHANAVGLPRMMRVFANRGVSGIDGCVATAAGIATGAGEGVLAILGDITLLHDLNSLALLRSSHVLVVVLNNDGGRIFERLPIAARPELLEPWFTTPHGMTFGPAAQQFGIAYESPQATQELATVIGRYRQSGTSAIIELDCR